MTVFVWLLDGVADGKQGQKNFKWLKETAAIGWLNTTIQTMLSGGIVGTSGVATTAQGLVDVITGIIQNGPSVAASPTSLGLTMSGSTNVLRAAAIVEANKDFIVAEAIAYINNVYGGGFKYDQAKCYRDVGYMIDSISFDLLYGGNRQAIQSAVYYYQYNTFYKGIYQLE